MPWRQLWSNSPNALTQPKFKMKQVLIVGGANGIGLAVGTILADRPEVERVHIVDKAPLQAQYKKPKISSYEFDLTSEDYSFFDQFTDIDTIFISAGFGKLALLKDVPDAIINTYFQVNTIPAMRLIRRFYSKLESDKPFYCGVMVSISAYLSSPFFSVYGATKAALRFFIESINVELEKGGSDNRVLNISPGSIKGTSFNQGQTDLRQTEALANEIIENMEQRNDLFIPQYEEIFKKVLERYQADFREEGRRSYDYKLNSGRL